MNTRDIIDLIDARLVELRAEEEQLIRARVILEPPIDEDEEEDPLAPDPPAEPPAAQPKPKPDPPSSTGNKKSNAAQGYSCPHCDRTGLTKRGLAVHIGQLHKESDPAEVGAARERMGNVLRQPVGDDDAVVPRCETCGNGYTTLGALVSHIDTEHPERNGLLRKDEKIPRTRKDVPA